MVELKDGYAQFKLPVRPEYLQGAKIMQGGLIDGLVTNSKDRNVCRVSATFMLLKKK